MFKAIANFFVKRNVKRNDNTNKKNKGIETPIEKVIQQDLSTNNESKEKKPSLSNTTANKNKTTPKKRVKRGSKTYTPNKKKLPTIIEEKEEE